MKLGYNKLQSTVEVGLVTGILILVVLLFPLGSNNFERLITLTCVMVALYAVCRITLDKSVMERWGFPFCKKFNPAEAMHGLEEDTAGCVMLGIFFIAGALPMIIVRIFDHQQIFVDQPWTYLVWCAIQDFLFFALLLRSLEDLVLQPVAILFTAIMFALSHYPFSSLMVVTALAGAVWGYAFIKTRSLMLITASHWLMGIVLLGQ